MPKRVILDGDAPSVKHLCARDKRFQKVFSMIGPVSYEVQEDGYSFLVHEIIEQMLSAKAANAIFGRLQALCGGHVCADAVNALTDEQMRGAGMSRSKVGTIRALTRGVESGEIDFSALSEMADEEVMKVLRGIRGIGAWTAKMYLLFALDRQDVLPFEDVAFLQGYGWAYNTTDLSPAAVQKKCAKWRPYSSVAARYMYLALDRGLTKTKFHLFQ